MNVNHLLKSASNSSLFLYQESDLVLLMKRDLKNVFQDCKMVAVVQNNASSAEDMMVLKHRLYKHNITVKFFPNQVKPIRNNTTVSHPQILFEQRKTILTTEEP